MKTSIMTYLALAGTVLFWGLSFIGTKIALTSFTPFTYIFLRLSLAAIVFVVFLTCCGLPKLTISDHKKLFLTALLEPGLYFTFETNGLAHTSASIASIIISIVPIAVMLLARVMLKEKISRRSLLGILLSITGIIILVLGDLKSALSLGGSLLGDVLILGAVISAAFYTVLARDLSRRFSALVITGFQMIYGAVLFMPLFLLNAGDINWNQISVNAVGAIIFLVIFATILAFLFYNYALSQIPASRAAVFLNGIPVVTAIGAWIILGERLTSLQGAGGILVLAAVIIANMTRSEKEYGCSPQNMS